jgi:integrase
MSRRPYGTGTLYVKAGNWYGRWRIAGRKVNRRLGPVRKPGTREGLTRPQAERELRRRMEQEHAVAPTARLTVAEAGDRLIDHLEALGRKKSTIEGYRSALAVHLVPFFRDKPLDRISREEIEAFMAHCARGGLGTEEHGELRRGAALDLRLRGQARLGGIQPLQAGRDATAER